MASRAAYDTTSPANLRDGSAHRDTGYSTDTSVGSLHVMRHTPH